MSKINNPPTPFYVNLGGVNEFIVVPDVRKVTFTGFEDFEFYSHPTVNRDGSLKGHGITISEGVSGMAVAVDYPTLAKAKAHVVACMAQCGRTKFEGIVSSSASRHGVSPRYAARALPNGIVIDPTALGDTSEKRVLRNREKALEFAAPFQNTFNARLTNYWEGNVFGFNVVKFDEEIVQSGDENMALVVQERWGDEGTRIIRGLLAKK